MLWNPPLLTECKINSTNVIRNQANNAQYKYKNILAVQKLKQSEIETKFKKCMCKFHWHYQYNVYTKWKLTHILYSIALYHDIIRIMAWRSNTMHNSTLNDSRWSNPLSNPQKLLHSYTHCLSQCVNKKRRRD